MGNMSSPGPSATHGTVTRDTLAQNRARNPAGSRSNRSHQATHTGGSNRQESTLRAPHKGGSNRQESNLRATHIGGANRQNRCNFRHKSRGLRVSSKQLIFSGLIMVLLMGTICKAMDRQIRQKKAKKRFFSKKRVLPPQRNITATFTEHGVNYLKNPNKRKLSESWQTLPDADKDYFEKILNKLKPSARIVGKIVRTLVNPTREQKGLQYQKRKCDKCKRCSGQNQKMCITCGGAGFNLPQIFIKRKLVELCHKCEGAGRCEGAPEGNNCENCDGYGKVVRCDVCEGGGIFPIGSRSPNPNPCTRGCKKVPVGIEGKGSWCLTFTTALPDELEDETWHDVEFSSKLPCQQKASSACVEKGKSSRKKCKSCGGTGKVKYRLKKFTLRIPENDPVTDDKYCTSSHSYMEYQGGGEGDQMLRRRRLASRRRRLENRPIHRLLREIHRAQGQA